MERLHVCRWVRPKTRECHHDLPCDRAWDKMQPGLHVLCVASAAVAYASSSSDDLWGGWTSRLGMSFSDECQEHAGLQAILVWAGRLFTGDKERTRSAHCETRQSSCPAGLAVTGLAVRSGHMRRGGSRELYDFALRCGPEYLTEWMGLRFDTRASDHGAAVCPEHEHLSGVQVMRGRGEGRDTYNFKLRCGKEWRALVGLPVQSARETRSATCARGSHVVGVRVHRGFQDWGAVDTYEFQLRCQDAEELREAAESDQSSVTAALTSLLSYLSPDDGWPTSRVAEEL